MTERIRLCEEDARLSELECGARPMTSPLGVELVNGPAKLR